MRIGINNLYLQHRYRISDSLFKCLSAVCIYLSLVLFAVGKTPCTAYAAACTGHSLDEILFKNIAAFFHERCPALVYSVAGAGGKLKVIYPLLLKAFCDCIGKAAAACKYPAEI